MICYKDMTFCGSDCANRQCVRNFTPEDSAKAKQWWGGDDVPVAFADLSEGCREYQAPTLNKENQHATPSRL